METQFRWAADDTIFPIHYYTRIFSEEEDYDPDDFIYYKYISQKVYQIYDLYDFVLSKLAKRKVEYKKIHYDNRNN